MKKILFLMLLSVFLFLTKIEAQNNLDNFPPMTVWAIQEDKLYYFVLSKDDDFEHKEGKIKISNPGDDDDKLDVKALAIDSDGTFYFINNKKKSVLYKINPSEIDGDDHTDVNAEYIGNTGLSGDNRLTNLEIINGELYAITRKKKKLYKIDKSDGSVTLVKNLSLSSSFQVDALAQANDGTVYFTKTKKPSELWKFDSFPDGNLSKVMTIEKSGKIVAMAGHPNGFLYAADDEDWFKIDPVNKKSDKIAEEESDIEGMDFYSGGEASQDDEENEADISLTASVDNDSPENGDEVKITLEVKNNGPYKATNLTISETLPSGLDFVNAVPSVGTVGDSSGKYIWQIPELIKDASANVVFTTKVNIENANNSKFDLGIAKDYNVFVLHDIEHKSDIEGKVAVGHDAKFDSAYSIGYPLHQGAPHGDVLIVNQNLTVHSGAIYGGDVVYGHDTSNVGTFNWDLDIVDGSLRKGRVINFRSARNYLISLSKQLARYPANMKTDFTFTKLTLAGNNPFINVFNVTKEQLNNSTEVLISAPNGSVVLVNVTGDSLYWMGGLYVTGTEKTNVLFNFYRAKYLEIQRIDVRGSILAPKTHVNFISGVQNGQMIAKDLEGGAQFNNELFVGNVPVDTTIVSVCEIISSDQVDPDSEPNNGDEDEDDYAAISININTKDSSSISGTGSAGNWELVSSFAEGEIVWVMTYDINKNMVAGTWGGNIYRSTDNGLNWSLINGDMNVRFVWSIASADNGQMFAGTDTGVFKSDVSGENWTAAGLAGNDVRSVVVHNNKVYAATWGNGIYVSEDAGSSWNILNDFTKGLNIHSILFDSKGNLIVATFDDGIYKSTDGGANFTHSTIDYPHIWILGRTSDDLLFAGTYGNGIYTSVDNGDSWSKEFDVTAQYIYSISVDSDNNVYASSWNGGVFALNLSGALAKTNGTWIDMGLDGFGVSSLLTQPGSLVVYAGTSDGDIYKDADGLTSVKENKVLPDKFYVTNNYPNPFNPSTEVIFNLPERGVVTLEIYNVLGEKVKTLFNSKQFDKGEHAIKMQMSELASGAYLFRIRADFGNKTKMITKKMLLLK